VNKGREYARRAFEHVDRLTARERYYVEGYYYSDRAETYQKAIDAYKKAIELYPDHSSAKHNLASRYAAIGQDQDAIPLYEDLRRRGMTYPQTYANLANAYVRQAQFDKAIEVLREYIGRNPDNAAGYLGIGLVFASAGRFDDALGAYDKSIALDPANLRPVSQKWSVFVAREQWPEAAAVEAQLEKSSDPQWRYLGFLFAGDDAVYKGHVAAALKAYDSAATAAGRGTQSATARLAAGQLLLANNQAGAAAADARRAFDDAARVGPQPFLATSLVSMAETRLGHAAEAAKAADEMRRLIKQMPPGPLIRQLEFLQAGRVALERHDTVKALEALKQADALVPPGPSGYATTLFPAAIFLFPMGEALLASKNDVEAAKRFQRIVDSAIDRAQNPIEFVRSLYYLAQINERRGDTDKARTFYRRFLEYWGDGEIDRDRVGEARRKIG